MALFLLLSLKFTFINLQLMYITLFQELTVTDDTVLEEHSEDPALVQMTLLGDGGKIQVNLHIAFDVHIAIPRYGRAVKYYFKYI